MSKQYVSVITTNSTKPYTPRFVWAVLIMLIAAFAFAVIMYSIFNNGYYSNLAKPVTGATVLIESYGIYRFWKWIRD